jgi:hypothetical protein
MPGKESKQNPGSPLRVAKNLIATYGLERFTYLMDLFRNNISGPIIASEFSVTRQRVNQWRNILGEKRTVFIAHPEVEKLLGVPDSNTTTI